MSGDERQIPIVDDESTSRRMLLRLLEPLGKCEVVGGGYEAVTIVVCWLWCALVAQGLLSYAARHFWMAIPIAFLLHAILLGSLVSVSLL